MGGLCCAFIMDPIERILVDKDTTFVFMLEAQKRGHDVFYMEISDLFVEGAIARGRFRRVEVRRAQKHFSFGGEDTGPLSDFDVIFMRKDPPVDIPYLHATHFLSFAQQQGAFVINNPRGLREANEKLYALNFPEIAPSTLITSDLGRLKNFVRDQGGEAIIKPIDGHGGLGVFYVHEKDRNFNSLLETATQEGRRPIIVQRYLPEVRQGDKRLIVLNGEPLAALLRIPREDDHRGNIHVGGKCLKTEISDRDREICQLLSPRLRRDGLYFVGLDIIGGYLTEVNVTSPTGVQEINDLNGTCLEARVIDFVEQQVEERRGATSG